MRIQEGGALGLWGGWEWTPGGCEESRQGLGASEEEMVSG